MHHSYYLNRGDLDENDDFQVNENIIKLDPVKFGKAFEKMSFVERLDVPEDMRKIYGWKADEQEGRQLHSKKESTGENLEDNSSSKRGEEDDTGKSIGMEDGEHDDSDDDEEEDLDDWLDSVIS